MTCPHCGADRVAGHRFCGICGQPVADAGAAVFPARSAHAQALDPETLDMRRPSWVTVVAILDFLFGGLVAVVGALWIVFGFQDKNDGPALIGLGAFALICGGWVVATGVGLLRLDAWARISQMVVSVLSLIQIPCGTLVGVFALVYLLKPGVKVLFSGRAADELTPREAVDVASLSQSGSSGSGLSTVSIVVGALVLPLVMVAMIGIIAAIAIPSLLRARIAANEADAIGDTRTLISAQVSYQKVNGGRYGTLACLAAPSSCLSGYSGPAFIDPALANAIKQGYRRTFTLSADGQHYTLLAVPVTPGGTGARAFCGGETGLICQTPAGSGSERVDTETLCDSNRCTPI
jgi:type II secretory pathway pseudopilin PulG